MFDHLHRGDEIECPERPGKGGIGDVAMFVADGEARGGSMGAGDGHIFLRGIHAGHVSAEPGEGFREKASAAADIDRALARKWTQRLTIAAPMPVNRGANISEPRRVEAMQHRRAAFRVPPIGGERIEMRGFGRVDAGCGHGKRCGTRGLPFQPPVQRAPSPARADTFS